MLAQDRSVTNAAKADAVPTFSGADGLREICDATGAGGPLHDASDAHEFVIQQRLEQATFVSSWTLCCSSDVFCNL